jgi:hypothetical protein
MPSPIFTFRMPQKDREALNSMAKIYGAPSSGAFVAEMVGVMCSGDSERVKAFVGRLIARAGEQMALQFGRQIDEVMGSKPAPKPVKALPLPRKGGRRAKRSK